MLSFLVIAPHPDDAELGMGGTVARLARQGHRVHILDMTDGEPTPRGSKEIRARESAEASRVLNVARSNLGLTNREVQHAIEARHKLATVIREHRPKVLFVPYPVDAHPDHVAVARIAEDARFDAKLTKSRIPGEPWHPKRIIYYFCTHLRLNINPTFCIDISEDAETKFAACRAFASQVTDELLDMVRTQNHYFGGRIGTAFAEPFFSHEVIGLGGLSELV